ncbi:MAG: nucleoside monophosphate kinase [Alphaproteobacteria bacterium]|nr:nucleoside monophosphate kinase [Alphaproteobacteria bacterium]
MYILFGYPGAGKGTFADALKGNGYRHISTGDILREEVKKKTSIGLKYKKEIEASSHLLPTEVVESILLNRIKELIKKNDKLILDGFPKTIEQAKYLDELIDGHSLSQSVDIIYLDISMEQALARVQTRTACSDCRKIYNSQTAKPMIAGKCDICGAPLFQRTCDTKEGFRKRISLFNKTVKKTIDYYKSHGKLIRINADMPLKEFIEQVIDYDKAH